METSRTKLPDLVLPASKCTLGFIQCQLQLPVGPAWRKTPAGFYLLALLFILFDAEAAFLFVWVLGLREVGPTAFWAMVAFLAVLLLGWASFLYFWFLLR